MKIKTVTMPSGANMDAVLEQIVETAPSFVTLHHRAQVLPAGFLTEVRKRVPAVHVASSCHGIMSHDGLADIGLFLVHDPEGDYGSACASFGESVADTAKSVTEAALARAGREGEAPDLIWVSSTPGCEEEALAGIETCVGKHVPIIGGSAADDTVEGNWSVSDGDHVTGNGLTVSVLFCSTPLNFAYQNGYAPTMNRGLVTRAEGRKIQEIDNRPAADVYDIWNQGAVPRAESSEVNVLSSATLWPLGRLSGTVGGFNSYLLAHPSNIHPDGAIECFAEVQVGEEVTQMVGDRSALAARAGRVSSFALKAGRLQVDDVAGALVVYCGGCRLAVEELMEDVVGGVCNTLEGRPFLGVFTFGEQGPIHGKGNCHGNLMISCVAFAQDG